MHIKFRLPTRSLPSYSHSAAVEVPHTYTIGAFLAYVLGLNPDDGNKKKRRKKSEHNVLKVNKQHHNVYVARSIRSWICTLKYEIILGTRSRERFMCRCAILLHFLILVPSFKKAVRTILPHVIHTGSICHTWCIYSFGLEQFATRWHTGDETHFGGERQRQGWNHIYRIDVYSWSLEPGQNYQQQVQQPAM